MGTSCSGISCLLGMSYLGMYCLLGASEIGTSYLLGTGDVVRYLSLKRGNDGVGLLAALGFNAHVKKEVEKSSDSNWVPSRSSRVNRNNDSEISGGLLRVKQDAFIYDRSH